MNSREKGLVKPTFTYSLQCFCSTGGVNCHMLNKLHPSVGVKTLVERSCTVESPQTSHCARDRNGWMDTLELVNYVTVPMFVILYLKKKPIIHHWGLFPSYTCLCSVSVLGSYREKWLFVFRHVQFILLKFKLRIPKVI